MGDAKLSDAQLKEILDKINEKDGERIEREDVGLCQNLVAICDGSSEQVVRDWIQEMETTKEALDVRGGNRLVRRTTKGALKKEAEKAMKAWKAAQPNPEGNERAKETLDTPWEGADGLKAHITKAFLSTDEQEVLKSRLETFKQGPMEEIKAYNRRFEQLAHDCYGATFEANVLKDLFKWYARGLKEDFYARKIVEGVAKAEIKDLPAAFTKINKLKAAEDGFRRLGRRKTQEEGSSSVNSVDSRMNPAITTVMERLVKVLEDNKGAKLLDKITKGIMSAESGARPKEPQWPKKKNGYNRRQEKTFQPKPRTQDPDARMPRYKKQFQPRPGSKEAIKLQKIGNICELFSVNLPRLS